MKWKAGVTDGRRSWWIENDDEYMVIQGARDKYEVFGPSPEHHRPDLLTMRRTLAEAKAYAEAEVTR